MARSLAAVQEIVRLAARELTGDDGATFVLREGEQCFYADEDAIAPLWNGKRFPLSACISGWTMLNRESVAIEDTYADPHTRRPRGSSQRQGPGSPRRARDALRTETSSE
jgi:hypothetical protein